MSDSEVLLWTRDTKHVTFINSICDLSVINLLLLLFNWFIEPNSNLIFLFYPVDLTYFLLNLIHWIMNMKWSFRVLQQKVFSYIECNYRADQRQQMLM